MSKASHHYLKLLADFQVIIDHLILLPQVHTVQNQSTAVAHWSFRSPCHWSKYQHGYWFCSGYSSWSSLFSPQLSYCLKNSSRCHLLAKVDIRSLTCPSLLPGGTLTCLKSIPWILDSQSNHIFTNRSNSPLQFDFSTHYNLHSEFFLLDSYRMGQLSRHYWREIHQILWVKE